MNVFVLNLICLWMYNIDKKNLEKYNVSIIKCNYLVKIIFM